MIWQHYMVHRIPCRLCEKTRVNKRLKENMSIDQSHHNQQVDQHLYHTNPLSAMKWWCEPRHHFTHEITHIQVTWCGRYFHKIFSRQTASLLWKFILSKSAVDFNLFVFWINRNIKHMVIDHLLGYWLAHVFENKIIFFFYQ